MNVLRDSLRAGLIIWVDCADSQPCVGTCGSMWWTLKPNLLKRVHSCMPHMCVSALEFANTATVELPERIYRDFPADKREGAYSFAIPSTMKPTTTR